MRLNPDCIRDILLYVEENIDSKKIAVSTETLINSLTSYDENTIHYHVQQIDKFNFVDRVAYGSGIPILIFDLSPNGHEFLAHIRSNNNWNKTKDIAKNIGVTSLDAFIQIASTVTSDLISKYFMGQ